MRKIFIIKPNAMENSSLNMAHFYSRKADNHLRYRRYDDAIASHQKASELLEEAISKTTVPKSIESLQLQRDYHIKHKDLVLMKKYHFDKYTRALEQQKKKNAQAMEQMAKDRIESSCQLQLAIYKTMEDTDSLLEVLCNKGSSSDCSSKAGTDGGALYDPKTTGKYDDVVKSGIKKPKDDSTVIEELRTLNHQLHILVFQLVSQLDEVNQESDILREKIKLLERSKSVQSVLPLRQHNINVNQFESDQQIDILTDSIELDDVINSSRDRTLITGSGSDGIGCVADVVNERNSPISESRELPPLELPTFDFTTFECKNEQ